MKAIQCLFIIWGFLAGGTAAQAQTQKVSVSISGLTCSQCSRSVEMQLKKLAFIQSVEMDLKNTTAVLNIRSNARTDFRAIARAVTDAGFSVAGLEASMYASQLKIDNNGCMQSADGRFYIVNSPLTSGRDLITFEFLGKPFNSFKVKQQSPSTPCQKNATYFIKARQ